MVKHMFVMLLVIVIGISGTTMAGQRKVSDATRAKIKAMLDQTVDESGLTQEEIDAYIGFINRVAKARGKRRAINKAIKETGMTEVRLLYIKMKTDIGCMVISGLPASVFANSGDQFQPTEEEMELIKNNHKELQAASFTAEFPLPE